LKGLSEDDLESILTREGADVASARMAAIAASGNLRRARVLVRDAALGERISTWRTVPERLTGTPAASAALAGRYPPRSTARSRRCKCCRKRSSNTASRTRAKWASVRSRTARTSRRSSARAAPLSHRRASLRVDRAHQRVPRAPGAGPRWPRAGDSRSEYRVGASLQAIDVIVKTNQRLSSNIDETLLLNDLMLSLMEL